MINISAPVPLKRYFATKCLGYARSDSTECGISLSGISQYLPTFRVAGFSISLQGQPGPGDPGVGEASGAPRPLLFLHGQGHGLLSDTFPQLLAPELGASVYTSACEARDTIIVNALSDLPEKAPAEEALIEKGVESLCITPIWAPG